MPAKKGSVTNTSKGNKVGSVGQSKKSTSSKLTIREWMAAHKKSPRSTTAEETVMNEQPNTAVYRALTTLDILEIILDDAEPRYVRSVRNTCKGIREIVNESLGLSRLLFTAPTYGDSKHQYKMRDYAILPLNGFNRRFPGMFHPHVGWAPLIYTFSFEQINELHQKPKPVITDRFFLKPALAQMAYRFNLLARPTKKQRTIYSIARAIRLRIMQV